MPLSIVWECSPVTQTSNGKPDKFYWFDQALAGESDQIKARVQNIVLKYGIDPEDEFFIIFTALGKLQVLIEDSPNDWQQLFTGFQEELNRWSQTNLQTLKALSTRAVQLERLIATLETLSTTSTKSTKASIVLMGELSSLRRTLKTTNDRPPPCLPPLDLALTQLEVLSRSLQETLNRPTMPPAWTWSARSPLTWGLSALLALNLAGVGVIYFNQKDQAQKVDWLLYKGNRYECLAGIKRQNSPECQGL